MALKDDLDLDMFPLKMCGFLKYICMPNMKYLPAFLILASDLPDVFRGSGRGNRLVGGGMRT